MDFKQALSHSLKIDKRTLTDPFLLHSSVSDLVGNDYEAKKAAEEFYRLDTKYGISKTIHGAAPLRYPKREKHYYKVKPMPIPPDNAYVYFDENSDTLHLSGECPALRGKGQVYRSTYDHARMLDFRRICLAGHSRFYGLMHFRRIARLSKFHRPCICRRCGDFTERRASSIVYRFSKRIFDKTHVDIRLITPYAPSVRELVIAWLEKWVTQKIQLVTEHREETIQKGT